MSIKDIARYRAEQTGNTVEEEMQFLRVKREISIESLFGVDENNGYLRYEWEKKNKGLGGRNNEY